MHVFTVLAFGCPKNAFNMSIDMNVSVNDCLYVPKVSFVSPATQRTSTIENG